MGGPCKLCMVFHDVFHVAIEKGGDVMKSTLFVVIVVWLLFCAGLTALVQVDDADAQGVAAAAAKGKPVTEAGKGGVPTILLRWTDGELCPYQLRLGVQEYRFVVRTKGAKHEKVVVVELPQRKNRIVVKGETDKKVGPIMLKDGVTYGVYVGDKEISLDERPDCVIECSDKAKYCGGTCIQSCSGGCPPGYYAYGIGSRLCNFSVRATCCCRYGK